MSDETKGPETNDDRYVKICRRIQEVGAELREAIFCAVEADDFDTVAEMFDELKKIEGAYLLSLKRGAEIIEQNRVKPTEAELAAAMAKEQAEIDIALAKAAEMRAAGISIS